MTALPDTPPPLTDAGTDHGSVYPLPAGVSDDPRFTFGLLVAVADVLTAHGYPPPRTGADLIGLRQALFNTLYQPRSDPTSRPETP